MSAISEIFTIVLLNPMVNFLVILNEVLFGSFGLAIIAFTIIIRLVTFPLTLRQLHSTRAMQGIQPRINEINKKYSDPKRRQEEIMRLYREAGVNPLGCVGPLMLQFPVLIALYSAVRLALATSPEALEKLSGHLYSWSYIQHSVPVQDHFIGMDLRTGNILMVVLVALSTWAQTKTTVTVTTDERARAQQQMMTYMMPVMFGFFAINFPSGVSLYWVVNSVVGIGFNIAVYGFPWLKIEPFLKGPAPVQLPALAEGAAPRVPSVQHPPARETRTDNGPGRSKRQNRRRRP